MTTAVPLRRTLSSLVIFLLAGSLCVGPAAAQSQTESPEGALALIDSLRGAGEFREALNEMNTLRQKQGDTADILWRMSMTRVDIAKTTDSENARDQHYQEALKLAEKALVVDGSNANAHLAKAVAEGRIALDAGTRERVRRSRAVKKHADRAIELDSTLDGAYHTRARWHREVSDLNFFERTIVKTVYGGLPEASFEHSVRDFKRAIELHDERFHHLELAKTYLKMDRRGDARKELQTVLDMPATEPFDDTYAAEARELLDDLD